MTILIIINTIIFSLLSALHFYWALGGKSFSGATIPVSKKGERILNPGIISTLIVAFGLIVFALVIVGNTGVFEKLISTKFIRYATYGIAAIFLLRAMGDFKFLGFFKKIKGTAFAKKDTKIYSPLCLALSISSFVIAFSN